MNPIEEMFSYIKYYLKHWRKNQGGWGGGALAPQFKMKGGSAPLVNE
jgi:hypothetical protein